MGVPPGERIQLIVNQIDQMQAEFARALKLYNNQAGCNGSAFEAAEDFLYKTMFTMFDKYKYATRNQVVIESFEMQASDLVDLGDISARKQCYEEARASYMGAIRVFTGSVYAAARQRAQIGMEEIRGK